MFWKGPGGIELDGSPNTMDTQVFPNLEKNLCDEYRTQYKRKAVTEYKIFLAILGAALAQSNAALALCSKAPCKA